MVAKISALSLQLVVLDLERSIDYYTKVPGFTVSFRYEDIFPGVGRNGFIIHLKSGEPREHHTNETDDVDMTFTVDDAEALFEEFKRKAAAIVQPLRTMPYGKEAYVSDPDG